MCLTKCELLLKGTGMREAEHLASLPVVLTMVLTYPLIPSKLGHGWGWGWERVCMGADEDEEEVVGFLYPWEDSGEWKSDR